MTSSQDKPVRVRRCDKCESWKAPSHGNGLTGECRHNPPAYSTVIKTIWPHTRSDDWCGQFAALPPGEQAP